ncbi:MAG: AAA-like domain-containing protein [Candidatus Sumerlaeota bacterium]|nr:AAA-like domain-containing protein [Candidatus Sumerlaeota bacterium]
MKRFFNVAGPCVPGEHYMLPAQARCADLMPLVEQKAYFCIHAPRQTGKTTMIQDFVRTLNASGRHYALYATLETANVCETVVEGARTIMGILRMMMNVYHPALRNLKFGQDADYSDPENVVLNALTDACARLDRPLVIMFDEADSLKGPVLISFLRQLRSGYINRAMSPFVHSIALVGMRNLRDYKGKIRDDSATMGSASPFNIVTEALTIRNFMREEIAALYAQHAEDTGQVFSEDVVDEAWRLTCGQPYLVNALAKETVEKILGRDVTRAIKKEHIEQAAQNLIMNRVTHIDSLMERLREERVRRIIEPVITGADREIDTLDNDYQYVLDLGLIKRERGEIMPANPIYGEVIVRTLNNKIQNDLEEGKYPYLPPRYIEGDRFDMSKCLKDFQQFWREHSAIWTQMPRYQEAAPHLILAAFLQNSINSRGSLDREYASGRGRMDLCVWFLNRPYPVELKIRRSESDLDKGIEQLNRYMDTVGTREGWLLLFDQRPEISWEEKIYWRTRDLPGDAVVHCAGC